MLPAPYPPMSCALKTRLRRATLGLCLALLFPVSAERAQASEGRHALFASYATPPTSRELEGRTKILDFLVAQGFELTLVTDRYDGRYPTREGRSIAPTPSNFLEALNSLAADPTVRELVVFTDLHGEKRGSGEITHPLDIAAPGHDAPEPGDRFSIDLAIPALRTLVANGARVAWMDFSCYSGATIALREIGVCAASSGQAELPTFPDFIDRFADALVPGISFEDAFLSLRKNYGAPVFPAISSAIGAEIVEEEAQLRLLLSDYQEGRARALLEQGMWSESERKDLRIAIDILRNLPPALRSAGTGAWLIAAPRSPEIFVLLASVVRAERAFYDRRYRDARNVRPRPINDPADAQCRDFRF